MFLRKKKNYPLVLLSFVLALTACNNPSTTKAIEEKDNSTPSNNPIYQKLLKKREFADSLKTEKNLASLLKLNASQTSNYQNIGLSDGYYGTDIPFLKQPLDSIDFEILYKISFGDQVEKVLRIKRADTLFDLSLALIGSDGGQSWLEDIHFINDSIFLKTRVNWETSVDNQHFMAYKGDSIVRTFAYSTNFDIQILKSDSFPLYKEEALYYPELQDSSFKFWSNRFEINGSKCRWEYDLKYVSGLHADSKQIQATVLAKRLIESLSNRILLELDLKHFPEEQIITIGPSELGNYKPDSFDINFDGDLDFQFHDRMQSGANHQYFVYLFNPNSQNFTFAEELSGWSFMRQGIQLDKLKKTATYSLKNGGGQYSFEKIHFDDLGGINFTEQFWNDEIVLKAEIEQKFHYLKSINNLGVDSLTSTKKLESDNMESQYNALVEWMTQIEND